MPNKNKPTDCQSYRQFVGDQRNKTHTDGYTIKCTHWLRWKTKTIYTQILNLSFEECIIQSANRTSGKNSNYIIFTNPGNKQPKQHILNLEQAKPPPQHLHGNEESGHVESFKNISAAFSRFLAGLSGASVSRTGCSSGNVCSWSLVYKYCQIRSISFQSVTMPCSIG